MSDNDISLYLTKCGNISSLEYIYNYKCKISNKIYHCALIYNNINVLQWIKDKQITWDYKFLLYLIDYVNLETLIWLYDNNFVLPDKYVLIQKAHIENKQMLEWINDTL